MIAASWPRAEPLEERLLHVDPGSGRVEDRHIRDLPSILASGDLLVVNDAATLPASLVTADRHVEVRLMARLDEDRRFRAVLFGAGDHCTPTEHRPPPPVLRAGATLEFARELTATVEHVDREEPRLVELAFDRSGAALYQALYANGRPIQYAHVPERLPLWHVQNHFAAAPWAFEAPSAGRPLTWGLLASLRRRGIELAHVTHAAGISSTGSAKLDARLPGTEHYRIERDACDAVRRTRRRGGRVVAVGTTVVRALESAARLHGDGLEPTEGNTSLLVDPGFRPAVVDGVLSGMHARGTSHYSLLGAFASEAVLEASLRHAEERGYLEHEFGDSCLLLRAPG